jgi:hypothetical protein
MLFPARIILGSVIVIAGDDDRFVRPSFVYRRRHR